MEEYRLETPEAVGISYEIAGIGTRFLAAALDFVVLLFLGVVVGIGTYALSGLGGIGAETAAILGLTLYFLLLYGYFVIFEALWSGHTPGKAVMGIRVIKTSGYPIGFAESAIRNLVRIVDFLPLFYGVGVLVMFISPRPRRLGDFAAGTIVIRERSPVSIGDLHSASRTTGVMPQPPLGAVDPEELEWDLGALTSTDLQIVQEFLDRAPRLREAARVSLGNDIATRLARRIGAREPLNAQQFLQRVTYLHDEAQD